MQKIPELTVDYADKLVLTAMTQLRTSRDHKRRRLAQVKENEDLYYGIIPKSIRNPYNDCFPYMAGFVDTLMAKIDDPPIIKFGYNDIADYKLSQKYTAVFEKEAHSPLPNAKWGLKDRLAKKNAIFSGRAIYKYYAEATPDYQSNLFVVDHYDFHCEPRGGAILENHLFNGEEGIYKTRKEIVDGAADGFYDAVQAQKLLNYAYNNERKDNNNQEDDRNNRERDLGLDSVTNNYVGDDVYKFMEWYLTKDGVRWYLLFNYETGIWIRAKLLTDIFPSGRYPYKSWATNEEATVFWSKAPADDARVIAKNINTLFHQELYNRQKKNEGQRLYDPTMIKDVEALANPRPDGLIPTDTKQGTKPLQNAVYRMDVGELTSTIDLVSYLNAFGGEKTGVSPSSQGSAEANKKVGIFFGEMKEIQERLGLTNKSYRECWEELGLAFEEGIDYSMTKAVEIKIMGAKGYENTTLSSKEKKDRALNVKVTGGQIEEQENAMKNTQKMAAFPLLTAVNPKWKDEEILRINGFSDEDIKNAFDPSSMADREIISMAAQAEQDIVSGKTPKVFYGANAGFIQHIIDFAKDEDLSLDIFNKLIDYAQAHAKIAALNEKRNATEFIRQKMMAAAPETPTVAQPTPSLVPSMPSAPPIQGNPAVAASNAQM